MDTRIDRRFFFFPLLVTSLFVVCAVLLILTALPVGAEDASLGKPVTDPLGVASFMPPKGWIKWDFWGVTAFSPTTDHNPRITFAVHSGNKYANDQADKAMKNYVRTFSTENYTLVEKEGLFLGDWSGVRVLARGTEKNTLFDGDYIWIQDYFTDEDRISLIFRGDPESFETYKDTVLKSFQSLVIIGRHKDGS